MLNGAPRLQTWSMLLLGRLIVSEHPATGVWIAVPPGHSAESNGPPLLLLTVKVKRLLPQLHTVPVHTFETQSLATEQPSPTGQSGHTGPPQSMSVSSPFSMPSLQVGATDVVVVLLVDVLVELLVDVVVDVEVVELVLVVLLVEVVELVLVVLDVLLVDVLVELLVDVLVDVDVVELVLDEVDVVEVPKDDEVVTLVDVVVVALGQALPTPLRQMSFAPVAAAISLY